MRKFIALAAIALALSAAAPASATETLGTILFGRPSEPGIAVIILRPSHHDDDQVPVIYRHPSAATLARAQDEIATNPVIRASLERRNIRPYNVLAIQTALNGGKIIYVK
ncbi:hypothetical protein ADU59_22930 [Pararhizobium polonicum]|uniref:Uncharacterized protein n=1 Tax=Pararhizobium polonicum TaxID=1612624 RepID=A0A1C7NWB5_9HYPH|nr:hypothetical protein [Pararhizobium polonicum]OBZ93303.1 hypothetical protein ADU59_22930 [Pararhizobium polonicum]